MDSFVIDFRSVDDFFAQFNNSYWIDEMWQVTGVNSETGAYTYAETGSDCFELVLIESGGENISDYLDTVDGSLDTSKVNGIHSFDIGLDWYNRDDTATVELHDTLTYSIGDTIVPVKAILLRSKSSGYIMAYDINPSPIRVTNQLIFDKGLILLTFVKGAYTDV